MKQKPCKYQDRCGICDLPEKEYEIYIKWLAEKVEELTTEIEQMTYGGISRKVQQGRK